MNLSHPFYFGQVNKIFIYVSRYLNEILKLNPPMAEKTIFDKELGDALMRFRILYNSRNPKRRLPIMPGLQNEVFAAIGEMLGPERLRQETMTLRDPVMVKLLQGIPPLIIPPYSAEMAACDKKLAKIFGGEGAVAAGNGFEPKGGAISAYDGKFRGKGFGDEHLYSRMHLYGSSDKTKVVDIFIPGGGEYIGRNPYSDEDSYAFYYLKLYKVVNVTLFVSHVKEFIKPAMGTKFPDRTRIGRIGGIGGDSVEYIHSHLGIHKGRGYNEQNRIPFSDVFC